MSSYLRVLGVNAMVSPRSFIKPASERIIS
nr:MAG TPA: hypothetical protein [Bacteriophage sp.]